jgi:hypothetical protein
VPADYRLGPDQEQGGRQSRRKRWTLTQKSLSQVRRVGRREGAKGDLEQKREKLEHQVRITDRPLGWGPTLTFAPARAF